MVLALGVNTQTFNHYLIADRMPTGENLDRLAESWGWRWMP
jgi:hypothetical protein